MEKTEFDILGRVIYHIDSATKTIHEYEYLGQLRIITIINENNKSNFKTIRKQERIYLNGEYTDKEINEFGETYNIIKKYDNNNKEIYYEQTNIKTGKVYKKNTLWKDNKICLWTTEYDGNKNVGFYMGKDKLEKLTN